MKLTLSLFSPGATLENFFAIAGHAFHRFVNRFNEQSEWFFTNGYKAQWRYSAEKKEKEASPETTPQTEPFPDFCENISF